MSLTDEKLAKLRAAAARAADGWSPTSSSFAALEHCAEASPAVVMGMCAEVLSLREEKATLLAGVQALVAERDGMAKALELARAKLGRVREAAVCWRGDDEVRVRDCILDVEAALNLPATEQSTPSRIQAALSSPVSTAGHIVDHGVVSALAREVLARPDVKAAVASVGAHIKHTKETR